MERIVHQITHRSLETNGIRMHIAECGKGPLVLLCHGFPESWYSWRHQLTALAAAGFHAVAPDMRGFGQTDRPAQVDQYTMLHLVGDMVGLLDVIGCNNAVIVGHDMGAFVAWSAALLRPDRFRAVIGVSVPFSPRSAQRPTSMMPQNDEALYYLLYFMSGQAETEFAQDVRRTIRSLLYTGSADVGGPARDVTMVTRGSGWLPLFTNPASLPSWLTEDEVDFYVQEFTRTGFGGGLNWYRNFDRNWELMATFADAQVKVPALLIAGDHDLGVAVVSGMDQTGDMDRTGGLDHIRANMAKFVPENRGIVVLPQCGHWAQQEKVVEFNSAMLDFLRRLDA
jgi:pimeloyl-ACP methyl ester carboxylesterase